MPARRPDLVLINKNRTFHLMNFAISVGHRVKVKESKKIEISGSCQRAGEAVEHEGNTNCIRYP